MKTSTYNGIAKIAFLVLAAVLPVRQATATTVFHVSLPTTNNQIYEANIPFAGSIASPQFIGVIFSIPPYINTDPDFWEAAFSAGLSGPPSGGEAALLFLEGTITTPRNLNIDGFSISPGDLPFVSHLFSGISNINVVITGPEFAMDIFLPDGVMIVTPLPTALPLFATGLGALSLITWRRKRKNLRGT